MMELTLQYFNGCPNWETTAEHLRVLVEEGLVAAVSLEVIETDETAIARGFRGSPTLLIDGVDPFVNKEAPVGLACRVFRTENGFAGSPTLTQLRESIIAARERS